ncbi:MAG: DNA-binding protein [Thermoprotei archaeon]
MGEEYYDAELEEIKRRQLEALLRRQEEAKRKEEEAAREAQRQEILRRVMTPEARARLANVKLVKPELARAVEDYIINLALSGQLKEPIDEDMLKEILYAVDARTRREYKIKFREKR